MSNTLKLGNGKWATGKDTLLSFSDTNNNYKPLPFSFSRDTSGTVVNKDGLIETVGSGEPRIDFKDNTKGALLLEPTRTNLITQSELFSDSYWTKSGSSVTSGFLSPDGTANAFKLVESTSAGSHLIERSISVTSGATVTFSVFIKKGENNFCAINSQASGQGYYFDLVNGVVLGVIGSTPNDYKIIPLANDWFKISVTATVPSTSSRFFIFNSKDGASISYTGNGTSGVYIYGAQLEQGSYATSYIPTQGTVQTRVADNINQTTPNLSNSQEVTAFIDLGARPLTGINTTSNNFRLDFGTGNTRIIYNQNSSSNHRIELNINGSATYYTLSNLLTTTRAKIGISLTPTTLVIYANGVEYHSVSIASADWSNLLEIETAITDAIGNIKINDFKFYNTALTDQELIALTTI